MGDSLGLTLGPLRDPHVAQNGAWKGQLGFVMTKQLSNTLIKTKDPSHPTSHPPVCLPRWDCGYRDGGAGRVGSIARRWERRKGPSSAVSPGEENWGSWNRGMASVVRVDFGRTPWLAGSGPGEGSTFWKAENRDAG